MFVGQYFLFVKFKENVCYTKRNKIILCVYIPGVKILAESLPRRKSSLLKVQLGGLFLRDLATEGTIFPVLVFPNPVGEKNHISYYVGCIIVYENSHSSKLKTFLIPEREHKSLEEKFPPVEFTFSLFFQISFVELFMFYSVCL